MTDTIDFFKESGIPVFKRGEEGYERSVATANLLDRFSRPDFVLQPETPEHVQTIIQQAQEYNLKLTIKCGGHSYAGHSTAHTGVSLDLRRMNKTSLDMESEVKTVTFGGGCHWGHVYKTLINGRHDGFIVNGGRCPSVGVGGFLLGGGLGPFSRSVGMGSDTVKEMKIVTAAGDLVTVKDTDSPSSDEGRLFWALCGAGGGNFGVVVEMTLTVPQLKSSEKTVVAGRYQWFAGGDEPDLYDQADFVSTMNSFYTADWPEEITIDTTWICDLRTTSGNGVRFLPYFDGSKEDYDAIIDQYIQDPELATELAKHLAKQLKRRALPEKSTRFFHETLVAQWSEETVRAFPTNKTYSIYSSFSFRNDSDTMEKVTEVIREKAIAFRKAFPGERVEFLATFIHSGGKMSTPEPTSSAFFWREAVYHMYLTLEWEDKWMERDMRGFLGEAKRVLRPLALQEKAAFINFPDGALPAGEYEEAYWGDNYDELCRIKEIWDKDNFFQSKQGIGLPQTSHYALRTKTLSAGGQEETGNEWGFVAAGRGLGGLQEMSNIQFHGAALATRFFGGFQNIGNAGDYGAARAVVGDKRVYDSTKVLGGLQEMGDERVYGRGLRGLQLEETGDEQDDENLTDSIAGRDWEMYDTNDIVSDLQGLTDLGA